MPLGQTTPILRIFDEGKAREFYLDFLGFTVDWEHRFEPDLPLYMQVSKDECVLHLSEHYGDGNPGAAVRITATDLDAFHAELSAKRYKYARPGIEDMPWGTRDMSVKDPFGNRLTFTNASVLLLLAGLLAACAPGPSTYPMQMEMTTWSVVGVDAKSGDVGVAVASCVPNYGDAVAALVPGRGAAATQAGFDIRNRNKVFEAIKEGLTAEAVIARVTDPAWDKDTDRRQYGVLTMHDGFVRAAGFTTPTRQGLTAGEDGVMRFAGVMADPSRGVSSQGNTLASHEVVQRPLDAYRWDDPAGFNRLPDRLMRALDAGSIAGGDVRCNQGSVRQTTSMAAILVARGGDPPYATENIGMTDAGTAKAPWLNLSVRTERGAENPLLELRRQYDRWRRDQPR